MHFLTPYLTTKFDKFVQKVWSPFKTKFAKKKNPHMMRVLYLIAGLELLAFLLQQLMSPGWPRQLLHLEG